jgi:hypothetical protein
MEDEAVVAVARRNWHEGSFGSLEIGNWTRAYNYN